MRSAFTAFFVAVLSVTGFAETPWKFIAVGDSRALGGSGVNTTILGEMATEIVNQDADFVLFPGDLVQNGYQSELTTWRNTMQPVYDASIDVYPVRGNHENRSSITNWNNVFTGSYALPDNGPAGEENLTYSVTHNNAFLVGLDHYVNIHRTNQTWLEAQLAANINPHVFVFGHEPAFKVNNPDCLDNYEAERNAFWASIEGAGGRVYFSGHDHLYNHASVDDDGDHSNNIHQYIVGTGGAPLHDWVGDYDGVNSNYTVEGIYHAKQYGYVLCEIDGLDATLTWMERTAAGEYTATETWGYTAVPEPATVVLLALGGLALLTKNSTIYSPV